MSVYPPDSGPQAPERNPPIEPQWFKPSLFPIVGITKGASTLVTTGQSFGVTQNYVVGQLVRFNIPRSYGIQKLNGQEGYVIAIPSANQVTVNIDTSIGYDSFISSPTYGPTPPQIAAIGDINSGTVNPTLPVILTTIPGAFQNISPGIGVTP